MDLSIFSWSLYISIAAAIITFVGGLISYLDKRNENKRNNKDNGYNRFGLYIIGVGVFFTILSAIHAEIESAKTKSDKLVSDHKLDSVNNLIHNLQTEQLDSTKSIVRQGQKLIDSVNIALNTSKDISSHIYKIDQIEIKNLKNWDELKYPMSPIDIVLSYSINFKKEDFDKRFPRFFLTSFLRSKASNNGAYYFGVEDSTVDILKDVDMKWPILKFVDESRPSVLFKIRDVSSYRSMQEMLNNGFAYDSPPLYMDTSTFTSAKITKGKALVTVVVTRNYKNARLENLAAAFKVKSLKDLLRYFVEVDILANGEDVKLDRVDIMLEQKENYRPHLEFFAFQKTKDNGMFKFKNHISKHNFVDIE